MKARGFGVEIECSFPQGCSAAETWLRRFMPSWFEGREHVVGQDGSGTEIRSPILRGAQGFKELRSVFIGIVAMGGSVTASDGLHIHHDAPEFIGPDAASKQRVVRLVKNWVQYERTIEQFVEARRAGHHWCNRSWNAGTVATLEAIANGTRPARYATRVDMGYSSDPERDALPAWISGIAGEGALNLNSLTKYGSIEIRLHEGTLNADKAEAWIRFGQRFIDETVKQETPLQCPVEPDLMLKSLRLGHATQKPLLMAAVA